MAIIIAASVSLIYNAFAISVADRSKYLGMLASVGATRKQKRNSVFFEGLIISLISIPLGILAGLSGIGITFVFINKLIQDAFWTTETFKLVVTPGSILVAVVVSLLTVFISTYIPARKASKMTAIDAIRQVEDIKLTNKKVKTSKFIRKIFGMEAEIGLKNLKRNKRSYQATVFSIVISIVLFLSVTYFTDNMKKSVELTQNTYNYDMSIMLGYDDDEQFVHSVKDLADVTESNVMIQVDDLKTGVVEAETVTENHSVEDENGKYYYINLNVLDDVNLVAYAKKVGIDSKGLLEQPQAILVDTVSFYDPDTNRYTTSKIIHTKAGEKLDVEYMDWENEQDIYLDQLEIAAVTDEIPLGMQPGNPAYLNIFISENTFEQLGEGEALDLPHAKYLYVNSDDPIKTQKDIEEVEDFKHAINNNYQNNQSDKQLILLLSVFIYGFIVLIIAISIANILNTISTSISLRTREFAMLKSVGMTPEGFNKMIHYESIFYGIKALLYGLPLSIGTMLLMYKSFSGSFSYSFTLPWLQILYTIIAVFIIVGISMGHASSKVKKENIIDALKQDNI
jgi:putative ABC transport system permease protein